VPVLYEFSAGSGKTFTLVKRFFIFCGAKEWARIQGINILFHILLIDE